MSTNRTITKNPITKNPITKNTFTKNAAATPVVTNPITGDAVPVDARTEAWVPAGRRLVLIDIENVVGGSSASEHRVAAAFDAIKAVVRPTDHDVVITACGQRLLESSIGIFGSSVQFGRGIDGADFRLLEYLSPEHTMGRYASVTLASGDSAAFAEPVQRLATLGLPTDLVIGAGFVGTALYKAARSMTSLPALPIDATDNSFALAA